MPTHKEMYLVVQDPLITAIINDPSLRPSYGTALQYWIAPAELKMAYRPTRSSRYQALLKATMVVAKQEERVILTNILKLGDLFLPLVE